MRHKAELKPGIDPVVDRRPVSLFLLPIDFFNLFLSFPGTFFIVRAALAGNVNTGIANLPGSHSATICRI